MTRLCKIFCMIILINFAWINDAQAFIPPVFMGTEITAKIASITEKVNRVQSKIVEFKRYKHQFDTFRKQGFMGFVKMVAFTAIDLKIKKDKKKNGEFYIPSYMNEAFKKGNDAVIYAVEENMIPKIDPDSNQTEALKEIEIKSIQLKNQLLSDLYAKSLTIRTKLAKEREEPPLDFEAEDTRQLLTAINNLMSRQSYRYNDITRIEAAIEMFENANHLTNINSLKVEE